MYPSHYKYTTDHQWVDVSTGRIGVTHRAQHLLGAVVHIVLPQQGSLLTKGQPFSTIETCDAILELPAPVSGEVLAVNTPLNHRPDTVNANPHESWIVAVRLHPEHANALLNVADYMKLLALHSLGAGSRAAHIRTDRKSVV